MTQKRMRIISDGTGHTTRLLDANGDPVKWGGAHLTRVEVLPITPGGMVQAVLHVSGVGLDLDATCVVQSPQQAAAGGETT